MALNPTNLVLQAAPLPATFTGDPNAFFRAMIERCRIMSASGTSFFIISDVEPTSNQGPWLKGGTQWWVWSNVLNKYVPLDVSESETKWYQTGSTVPVVQDPPLWLRTTGGTTVIGPAQGQPVGWYLFNGTSWVGFTELVDGSVTLPKLADAPPGSLITFGQTNKALLLALGQPDKFLKVNSAGTAIEWGDIPATVLAGLLSSQVFGPLSDPGGYNSLTQSITVSMTESRDAFIYAHCCVNPTEGALAKISMTIDGAFADSALIGAVGGGFAYADRFVLLARQQLSIGNHTITVTIPATGGLVIFTDPVFNNNTPAVKFVVNLL